MRHSNEHGFTMIEVIVGIVLVLIIAGATAQFMQGATTGHVKQQNSSRLASAAEEGWELAVSTRPWRTNAACLSSGCTLPLTQTQGLTIRATMTAKEMLEPGVNEPTAYRVKVKVEQLDDSGNVASGILPAVYAGDVQNARAADNGTLKLSVCRVTQVDERSWPGACTQTHSVQMRKPRLGSRLYPGSPQSYSRNPQYMQWDNATADRTNYVTYTVVGGTTVDVRSIDLDSYTGSNDGMINYVDKPLSFFQQIDPATGHPMIQLPAGRYRIDIHDPLQTNPNWLVWKSKSIPSGIPLDAAFDVRISSGQETLIAKFYEPARVTVRLKVRTAWGVVWWKPKWRFKYFNDPDHNNPTRVMLIPFPQGRAVIPGVQDGNTNITRSVWPKLYDGDRFVDIPNIRPGLYLAAYYKYACDASANNCDNENNWNLKVRPVNKVGLGLGANGRWDEGPNCPQQPANAQCNPPYTAEHPRLPYLYVYRNGEIGKLSDASIQIPWCPLEERQVVEQRARDHKNANGQWKWYYDPVGGWMKLTQVVASGMHNPSPGGYSVFRAAKGGYSATEGTSRTPKITNRYKTIFHMVDDCGVTTDVYGGGGETL